LGILSGKDLLTSKYLTAEVTTAEGRSYFIPIKHPIDDYFVAEIEGQLYVFKITDKIKTYRQTAVKSFRWISYNTSHWMPLSPEDTKELELVLVKNSLPKVNKLLARTFKLLGESEKADFKEHNITELIGQILDAKAKNPVDQKNIAQYLKNLKVEKIITPVKKVSDFIQEDLLPTNPEFLGNVIGQWVRAETVRKKVMNTPITGKIPWLKIMLITALVLGVVLFAVWAWQSGVFNSIFHQPGQLTTQEITKKYPTPESLKAAIDRGDVDYDKLPADVKKIVDNVKLPVLTTP